MNRYRTIPGLGPQKAAATTTCQKCLKKDNYECKAGAQERPYISRPSRTQQLLNPKLKPRLTSDSTENLQRQQGIANEELARIQKARASTTKRSRSRSIEDHPSTRKRSYSRSSSDSVSTVSTNRSASPNKQDSQDNQGRYRSPVGRRYKHRDPSHDSYTKTSHKLEREDRHKSRRYSSRSPDGRGRPHNRGRRNSESRDFSHDRSTIAKQRRSLAIIADERAESPDDSSDHARVLELSREPQQSSSGGRYGQQAKPPQSRRERSLSPYSRRLALTQAMNMGR